MKISQIKMKNFKRFTNITIDEIPESARLIVLLGPNGSGKSSIFDGLKLWHARVANIGGYYNTDYQGKSGFYDAKAGQDFSVEVIGHDIADLSSEDMKKVLYLRTAFRHEPEFTAGALATMQNPLDIPGVSRTIDSDVTVSQNYLRLVSETVELLYSDELSEETPRREIRDRLVLEISEALARVLPGLRFTGVGRPLQNGTFTFQKGRTGNFRFTNLSAGERAIFDLLVDMVVKRRFFDNTLWCIDEPENHLNTRVQGYSSMNS